MSQITQEEVLAPYPEGAASSSTDDEHSQSEGKPPVRPRSRAGGGGGGGFLHRQRVQKPGGGRGGVDLRNTWQVVAGSILVPLGVVFILVAWYGAAHTPYVQQQIPYLVSGSFAGVGCMVLGGLLYWAHWLYRIYDQADQHHEEQLQVMRSTLVVLSERFAGHAFGDGASAIDPLGAGEIGGMPTSAPQTEQIGSSRFSQAGPRHEPEQDNGSGYVVTSNGSVYHDPACPVAAHHREGLRVLGPGEAADMEPCRICLL